MSKKQILSLIGLFLVSFLAFKENYSFILKNELKSLVEANKTIAHYQGLSFDLTSIGPYVLFKINNDGRFKLNYLKITTNKNIFERTFTNEESFNFFKSQLQIDDHELKMLIVVSFERSTIFWIVVYSFIATAMFALVFFLTGVYVDRNRKRNLYFLATQVAHDIRSPLEVLKRLERSIPGLEQSQHDRLRMSILRINEIADSLLHTQKNLDLSHSLVLTDVAKVLEEIIREKQVEFGHKPDFKINLEIKTAESYSRLPAGLLNRIISNLINNAIDATEFLDGEIQIQLCSYNLWNVIRIQDNGKGIPEEIRENIFHKGFTTKETGNGLGLYGAKTELERNGGKIEFESGPNSGTVFFVYLPREENTKTMEVALIDDDKLIRYDWESYAKERGVRFNSFQTVEAFLRANIQYEVILYIDSDLGNKLKGELVAQDLYKRGYKTIYLTTGYTDIDNKKYPWIKGIYKKTPSF